MYMTFFLRLTLHNYASNILLVSMFRTVAFTGHFPSAWHSVYPTASKNVQDTYYVPDIVPLHDTPFVLVHVRIIRTLIICSYIVYICDIFPMPDTIYHSIFFTCFHTFCCPLNIQEIFCMQKGWKHENEKDSNFLRINREFLRQDISLENLKAIIIIKF